MLFIKKRRFLVLTLVLGILLTGFISSKDPFFEIKKNFTLFSEVINEINDLYVVPVSPERIIRRGINAMLEELDPYTVLIDEADTQEIDFMTTGRYAGVGIEAGARNGDLVVIAPIDGYAAARAGIRAGDIIREVNGIGASELSPEDLNNTLRGEPGSKVTLVVERLGADDPITFELERERIEIKNVSFFDFADDESTIAYVSLSRFSQNAGFEVRQAIDSLSRSSDVEGLILDLRNNPGGLLTEAVRIVDLFLPADKIVVSTRGQNRQSRQEFRTEQAAVFADMPVVILQNRGSASSSEIVAGALQDHDRAVIIGEQSFGKGLVQIIRTLSYGVALKVTTSNYFIPSGRSIQSVNYGTNDADESEIEFSTKNGRPVLESTGIIPDIEFDHTPENALEIALLRENSYFFFANEFVSRNDHFDITPGQLFREFRNWLDENDFNWKMRSERVLDDFESRLLSEAGDTGSVETEISRIRTEMESIRISQFDESRETILRELDLELTSRFDGTTGRQKRNLQLDPLLLNAIEILKDTASYEKILSPND